MSDEAVKQLEEEPMWLDEAYIAKILIAYTYNDFEKLHSFTKKPATSKGENFSSTMHLIDVTYSTKTMPITKKTLSMLIKSRLENELMTQIEENINVFQREATFYKNFLPAAEKLMHTIGDETKFGPRPVYIDDRIIVLQNLKLLRYSIKDVKQGLNFDEIRIIITKLAKLHAVSMVLYKQQPEIFQCYLPGNVSEKPSPMYNLYKNAIKSCIDYCHSNPKFQFIVPKLEDFGKNIIPHMINVFSRQQVERFHVLNHGDLWVNNVMFKENDNGQLEDVLFIDFQESFFGSPGIDWNDFMFSSWQPKVIKSDLKELVRIYHTTLVDILRMLKYEGYTPTVEDVHKEIINKSFHGLTTATCLLPILINEDMDFAGLEHFLLETDDDVKKRCIIFKNPKYEERLQVLLSYFVNNGIL